MYIRYTLYVHTHISTYGTHCTYTHKYITYIQHTYVCVYTGIPIVHRGACAANREGCACPMLTSRSLSDSSSSLVALRTPSVRPSEEPDASRGTLASTLAYTRRGSRGRGSAEQPTTCLHPFHTLMVRVCHNKVTPYLCDGYGYVRTYVGM